MSLNGQPLGWALSETTLQSSGLIDIHGCVHFDTLPLEDVMPRWLRSLTKLIRQPANGLKMDAKSVLNIDPLGHLLRFDSSVRVDPLNEIISSQGIVEGRQLHLTVRSGSMTFANDLYLPPNSLVCDALSPQNTLPGLRMGQQWTVPVYSPLWPARSPLEIIHALVESNETIVWNNQAETCRLVVYRSDSGSPADRNQNVRGRLWARQDGTVLRQQVCLFDSTIVFDRMPERDATKLVDSVGPLWWKDNDELPGRYPSPLSVMPIHIRTPWIPPHMQSFLPPPNPSDLLWRRLRYPRSMRPLPTTLDASVSAPTSTSPDSTLP
jgi:hypothetical protein